MYIVIFRYFVLHMNKKIKKIIIYNWYKLVFKHKNNIIKCISFFCNILYYIYNYKYKTHNYISNSIFVIKVQYLNDNFST